ncbi:hypothetical protein EV589_2770 [Mycobacterium sp. BK558]|nr:hypothetical protein EV589_2770 [Mycobacterium sp. BK558]
MSSTSERRVPTHRAVVVAIFLTVISVLATSLGCQPSVAEVPAGQQRGFALPTWEVTGYDGPGLEQSLREIRALGANWVQFTPTWYQQTPTSSDVYRTDRTVSDSGQERAITLAHDLGLKVLLKPHLNVSPQGSNRIAAQDRPAWFASYTAFITHYATMAQRLGVEQLAIATELASMTDDRPGWLGVIQAVRDQYDGQLTYASSTDWERVPFWDALDLIGLDVYAPLSATPTTDVQALQQAAESFIPRIAALSARYDRKILFTEAGYTSQQGTATDPSSWRISTVPAQAEQAAAYQALLAAASDKPWWAGVFWWVWATPPYTEAEPLDFSPRGKEAEDVIRRWWTS